MPDPSQPAAQPTPATPSTASGGTPTASPPEVWRAGPDAPEWARGKTGAEITAITQQLMESVTRQGTAPAPAPAAPVAPGAIDPQAYATGQDILNAQQAAVAQFQPALERLAQQNAAATYRIVQTDPRYAETFQRYGPEVMTYLGQVPKAQWTVDIIEGAAKLVRADHLDELARERANQIVQSMEPTIRPTGGGASPQAPTADFSLKSEKLPQDWRDRAARVGLDEHTLDEFCFANGITRADFFKTFEKSLIVEVGKVKGV